MSPELLMSITAGKGLSLDHIPGGARPEWTPEDAALACKGLDVRRWSAFAYRWARDESQYSTLFGCLMNESVALAERERWPARLGDGSRYLEKLVRLAIIEDHHWIIGHAKIWPALMEVTDETWSRELERRYEGVRMILETWCHDAHQHIVRRIREDEAA